MKSFFKLTPLGLLIACLWTPAAYSATFVPPANQLPNLPLYMLQSDTPNVMILLDNSSSMKCALGISGCIDQVLPLGRLSKLDLAKRDIEEVATSYPSLRWGLMTFKSRASDGLFADGGELRARLGSSGLDIADKIERLKGGGLIDGTQLSESYYDLMQYFSGEARPRYHADGYYPPPGQSNSALRHRCQQNYAIVLTDGKPKSDDDIPCESYERTSGFLIPTYTCRNNTATPYLPDFDSDGADEGNQPIYVPPVSGYCVDRSGSWNELLGIRTCSVPLAKNLSPGVRDGYFLDDFAKAAYERDLTSDSQRDIENRPFVGLQNIKTYTIGLSVRSDLTPGDFWNGEFLPEADAIKVRAMLQQAAQYGRGQYFDVDEDNQLALAFDEIARDIMGQMSSTPPVVTTGDQGRFIFNSFSSSTWTSQLKSYPLNSSGMPNLTGGQQDVALPRLSTDRKLFTATCGAQTSTPFVQNTTLCLNGGTTIKTGAEIIRAIQGNPSRQDRQPNGAAPWLGDIIDSRIEEWNDAEFFAVGANDGMLHIFRRNNASAYQELLAYLPRAIHNKLEALTRTDYGSATNPHQYLVNGGLTVYQENNRTYLVGTFSHGAKGIFALDISSATDADGTDNMDNDILLWEHSSTSTSTPSGDNAGLGHIMGRPIIAKVRVSGSSTPVLAVISSGGIKTADNESAIYIWRLSDGSLIRKIATSEANGGLGDIAVLDNTGSSVYTSDMADFVYAGDPQGNVWRFNLTSSTPSAWQAQKLWQGSSNQPVVAAPTLFKTTMAGNNYLVLFGTGRHLYSSDLYAPAIQSLYAIPDQANQDPIMLSYDRRSATLRQRTLIEGMAAAPNTDKQRSLSLAVAGEDTRKGWFIDFSEKEQLTKPTLGFKNRLYFTTQILNANQSATAYTCDLPTGTGWIYGMNIREGTPLSVPAFDIDRNGTANNADELQKTDGSYIPLVGIKSTIGIPTELAIFQLGGDRFRWRYNKNLSGQINNRMNLNLDSFDGVENVRIAFGGSLAPPEGGTSGGLPFDVISVGNGPGIGLGKRITWRELF